MNIDTLAVAIEGEFAAIRKEMATKDDIKQIRSEMATKKDLENFATKADLGAVQTELRGIRRDMATRKDLEDFPTYNDVRNIVGEAKDELLKEMDKFKYAKEIDGLTVRVDRIEKELKLA